MPLPSAAEMNPSDDAVAVFGRSLLAATLALVVGGGFTMALLLVPGTPGDVLGGLGLGAVFGLVASLVVAPASGLLAAWCRPVIRRGPVWATVFAVSLWVVWVVAGALTLRRWGLDPGAWGIIWPMIPLVVMGLAASLWLARWVLSHDSPGAP